MAKMCRDHIRVCEVGKILDVLEGKGSSVNVHQETCNFHAMDADP
jgi:phosphopentomutase